jgi:alpha-tubulin suppressor-like RCC1 family protein
MKKNNTLKNVFHFQKMKLSKWTLKFFTGLFLLSSIPLSLQAQNKALYGWGDNANRQFGIASPVYSYSPMQLGSSTDWGSVVCGDYHTVALKTDGTLWTWGTTSTTPVQIGTSTDWASIAGGGYFNLAIKTNGTLWAWGANAAGQLGDGTTTPRSSPVQVGSSSDWSSIACGGGFTIGLKTDGTIWSWGNNDLGQLGIGTNISQSSPTQIDTSTSWTSIGCGSFHSFAIKTDGTLWGWGHNNYGQVGDGTQFQKNSPVQIGSSTWKKVTGGYDHTLGIKSDGTLWAWGNNGFGQIGDGTTNQRINPVQIGSATNWSLISGDQFRTLGIQTDGTLWAWGRNQFGQLGIGNTTNQSSPVQVGSSTNWSSAECGGFHTMGLVSTALPPVAQCQNVTVYTANACNAEANINNGSDDPDDNQITLTQIPAGPYSVGQTNIMLVVENSLGLRDTCNATVTVLDTIKPVASCKAFVLNLTSGSGTVSASDIDNNSSDNCGIATMSVSPSSFDCSDAGDHTVTLTVTDIHGNISSCDATVTVQYQPSCAITVTPANNTYTGGVTTNLYLGYGPQSATLSANASGGSGFTYSWSPSNGLSCSNCQSPEFTPAAKGSYTFVCTVTNSNGCSTECEVTFLVKDIRVSGKGGAGKVYLCHVPNGNSSKAKTLSISVNAVASHLTDHNDDALGQCRNTCQLNKRSITSNEFMHIEGMLEVLCAPNPFSSSFTLNYESNSDEEAVITIYRITGERMEQTHMKGYFGKAELGKGLSNGIYIVNFTQGSQTKYIKVIKAD